MLTEIADRSTTTNLVLGRFGRIGNIMIALRAHLRYEGFALALLVVAALLISSQSMAEDSIDSLIGKDGVYTLVNLHPDEQRAKLAAVNYQQAGLIPLCTEVTIGDIGRKRMMFVVKKTGKEYAYNHHKAAGESFKAHLARFFGTDCNTAKLSELSAIDQKGIKKGRALEGMTRQGVIYAMGYPPRHQTPDLEAPTWMYWQNRWNRVAVDFDENGKVDAIRE